MTSRWKKLHLLGFFLCCDLSQTCVPCEVLCEKSRSVKVWFTRAILWFLFHHCRLLASVVDMVQNRPGCLEPPALASLAWALTKTDASLIPSGVWEHVAAAVVAKMDRFTGQALVAVSMAFGDQQHQSQSACGVKVLQAVAARLPVVVHALTPSQCMVSFLAFSWS